VFAVGLLAGEAAIATAGYLVAHALALDPAPRRSRALALAPYLVVIVLWRAIYHRLGYGTFGSGVYLDPGAEPLAFARAFPARAVWLLASQLALPWSDFALLWQFISARAARIALGVAIATVISFALAFAPLCRRSATARFFAIGSLLAVIPISSTFPADRLLLFVGVGAMGLVGEWLATRPRTLPAAALAALLIFLHVILAAPLLALRSRSMVTADTALRRADDSIPKTPEMRGRPTILVNPPAFVGYVPIERAATGEPIPLFRGLASGTSAVELEREDDRTLRVRVPDGFAANATEQMLRSPSRPLRLGDRVELGDLAIEVTAAEHGQATGIRARFDRSLDDPSLWWGVWKGHGYVPFTPPRIGERVFIPPINLLEAVFGK
jgi:hypothetical protein